MITTQIHNHLVRIAFRAILITALMLCVHQYSTALTSFTDTNIAIDSTYMGSIKWADYDNDGDLDILITGAGNDTLYATIYRNDGANTFTNINAGLKGVHYSDADWGDYDNDGDLDLIINGTTGTDYSGALTTVYQNNGNNTFTPTKNYFTHTYNGTVKWIDFDNDGDLDLHLTGKYGSSTYSTVSKIYKNTLPDSVGFIDIEAELNPLVNSSVAWGDYDNDGDIDLLASGYYGYDEKTILYKNDYNELGTFTEVSTNIIEVDDGSLEWGDYDNDGDLDILLSGEDSNPHSIIYRNDGNDVFVDIEASLINNYDSKLSWADCDNDGDLDIVSIGRVGYLSNTGGYCNIYENNGSDAFTEMHTKFDSVYFGSIAWADFDNDGDLDLALAGKFDYNKEKSLIYKNEASTINTAPTAPTNFKAEIIGSQLNLSWNASTDTETVDAALSYNLFIYDKTRNKFYNSAFADTTTGYRTIIQRGNINTTSVTFPQLQKGTYSCGVQAIDHGYTGSSFSKTTFTVGNNAPTVPDLIYPSNDSVLYSDSICLHWSSYDFDHDAISYTLNFGSNGVLNTHTQNITSDSLWIKNLIPGKTYQWQIIATDNSGGSSTSNINLFSVSLSETEPNNVINQAFVSSSLAGFHGTVGTPTDEADYFCINYPKNGLLKYTVSNLNSDTVSYGDLSNAYIYDNNEKVISYISDGLIQVGETYQSRTIKINANQNYYIKISPKSTNHVIPYTITFSIDTNIMVDYYEENNSFETAYTLLTDSIHSIVGFGADLEDWYKFKTNNIGTFQLRVSNPSTFPKIDDGLASIIIYNSDKESIGSVQDYNIGNGNSYTTSLIGIVENEYYYIKVQAENEYSADNYTLKIISTVQQTSNNLAATVPAPLNIKHNETYIFPGDTIIKWACSHPENNNLNYSFYYGKSSPPNFVASGLTKNEYKIEGINWNDTIYWQAIAYAGGDDSVASPIYKFSARYLAQSSLTLKGLKYGSSNWGDFDNDGDLDLLLTGTTNGEATGASTIVYENQGSEKSGFTELSSLIAGVYYGDASWGDFDNDNDLDILICGTTDGKATGTLTKIYRNNGDATFTDINAGLPGVYLGEAKWADYNNDGLLDFAITGSLDGSSSGAVALLYKNNGNSTFTKITTNIAGIYKGALAWADYNNDGYIDLLTTGSQASSSYNTILYQNTPDSGFIEIETEMKGIKDGSASWGDYDNDGYLDIVLTGNSSNFSGGYKALIYKNNTANGSGFTLIDAELEGVSNSSSAWGDYNNDGYLDLIISGKNNSNILTSEVYLNNKNNTFTNVNANIDDHYYGSASWADYDNDNDLDLLITGQNINIQSIVYQNNIDIKNTSPNAPINLFSTITSKGLLMGWNTSTDKETDSLGLSYNLAIFDSNNKPITPHVADNTSGKPSIAKQGILQRGNYLFDTTHLGAGTYYWKVQALDPAFSASTWSETKSITISNNIAPEVSIIAPKNDSVVNLTGTILQWNATHANSKTMTFSVFFGTSPNNPELVASNLSVQNYTLPALNYGTPYFWRIEAKDSDGNVVSTPIHNITSKINEAPVITLGQPGDWSTLNNRSVTFTWEAYDPEGEDLHYTFQLHGRSFTDSIIFTNLTDTTIQIDTLAFNERYDWRVIAYDTYGNYTITRNKTFTSSKNKVPSIAFVSPQGNITFAPKTIELVWTASDPENEELTYNFEITSNDDEPLYVNNYTDTVFYLNTDTLVIGAKYTYDVTVFDSYGNQNSPYAKSFYFENSAPSVSLISPSRWSDDMPLNVDLVWQSSDLEDDLITYDVYFGSEYPLPLYRQNISDTTIEVGSLIPNTQYNWKVIAKDTAGNSTESTTYDFTTFSNNAPSVSLVAPEDWATDMPTAVTLSWEGYDGEDDPLTYSCYYFKSGENDTTFINNIENTSVTITNLDIDSHYQWRVIVTDSYGSSNEGDLWNFFTANIPVGWFKFNVIDASNTIVKNAVVKVQQEDRPDQEFITNEEGIAYSASFPTGKYDLYASKAGYFSNIKQKATIKTFDTTLVNFNLLPLGDFNNDSKIDLSDIDSVVANWRKETIRNEMGPVTGIAPIFSVEPDGVFDFEDIYVFSMVWDYYNTNENLILKSTDQNQVFDNNGLKVTACVKKENNLSNKLNYTLSFVGNGSISSSAISINYNPNNLTFAGFKSDTYSNNNDIIFEQHNKNTGQIKLSIGFLNKLKAEGETNFLDLTFERNNAKSSLPEIFYELNQNQKGKSTGKVSLPTEPSVSIYPNPAINEIIIENLNENTAAHITISSALGKVLYKDKLNSAHSIVDISNINEKILIVRIEQNKQIIIKKIVKTSKN